ncbi:hypothetical protein [Fluoribacter gormanii]|uniref:Uncharacterized protein n=1 Tax=Fluoribacter gormanii TaxID=464 RepID=A0A377GHV2_9GAMM|nr:hypothetical protein [Fluoribacter gormanii]KTD03382.1 hypothetical protein Lgor_1367 [Fluoribacter gormanii]SIQ51210.1 hypothetical protein SAMN05421777_101198 [Fluoribacter gormanii]STO24409.1 Uncharacterised protein [Fluoribacter gormanii]
MPREQVSSEKVLKTGALISFGNLFMSPFYARLGPFASLTLTAAALFGLHEVGRNKQSGNGFWGFFSNKTNPDVSDLNTTMKHVVEGGGVVFDQVFPPGKK